MMRFLLTFGAVAIMAGGCQGQTEPSGRAETPTSPATVQTATRPSDPHGASLEERWGIKVESLRPTAGGMMLDFRFRVIDPEKARPLFRRQAQPYVLDHATGTKFPISRGRLGQLRSTTDPLPDHTYFMLFSNFGRQVKRGAKVAVVTDDFTADNVTVE